MRPLPRPELLALEERLRLALRTGRVDGLEVLGYGEVTVALRLDTPDGPVACKRLPAFPTQHAASLWLGLVEEYIAELHRRGVHVIDTTSQTLEQADGGCVAYLLQPALPPATLGPEHWRRAPIDQVSSEFERILALLRGSVCPRLAADGQLSNWAFVDGDIVYLDVSTPFLRDERGRQRLDWDPYLAAFPYPLRSLIKTRILPAVLAKYHSLRVQVVDFLANLKRHGLDPLAEPLSLRANDLCGFAPPITKTEVVRYYANDARLYAALQAARRLDRWLQTRLLGRTYATLLPPRMDRNA